MPLVFSLYSLLPRIVFGNQNLLTKLTYIEIYGVEHACMAGFATKKTRLLHYL